MPESMFLLLGLLAPARSLATGFRVYGATKKYRLLIYNGSFKEQVQKSTQVW